MKFSISMRDNIVEALDEYADKHGVTRSAAINFIVAAALNNYNTAEAMKSMGGLMKKMGVTFDKVNENGGISEAQSTLIDDADRVYNNFIAEVSSKIKPLA